MLQRIGYGLSAALAMLFLTPLAQAQTVIGQDRDVVTRFIGPEGLSLLVLIAVVFIVVFLPLSYARARDRRRNDLYAKFLELRRLGIDPAVPGPRELHQRHAVR